MANIILRANIGDSNVNVEYKVLPLPLSNNEVELIISPAQGYLINKDSFSHGTLPYQISSMLFSDSGDNVIARITFIDGINSNINQNILLPIISQSILNIDTFKLNVVESYQSNIIVESSSSFAKSSYQDKDTYTIANTSGAKILVLSKTVIATEDFYFASEPSYRVTGNSDRYTSNDDIVRNANGNIIRKTFNIYYTSPSELLETNHEDTIEILTSVTQPPVSFTEKVATTKEEYEIYSFNGGRDIGVEGGIKIMKVKGVPGSQFKIVLQDGDKKTYNFKTGVFEAGGGMILGEIPPIKNGRGYGEAIIPVKIPKSTTNRTIETLFTTDKPIDHEALRVQLQEEKVNPDTVTGRDVVKGITTTSLQTAIESVVSSRFTFGFSGTGFTLQSLEASNTTTTSNTTILTPYGKNGTNGESISFTAIVVVSASANRIEIDRQSTATDWTNAAGQDAFNSRYVINTTTTTYGSVASDGRSGHVKIEGIISGITYGTGDITSTLNLGNFLTLHSI